VFIGFGVAFAHKLLTEGLNVLVTTVRLPLGWFSRVASLTGDMASELLGVGFIIGFRTSAVMMAGAVLGFLVILPTMALHAPTNVTYKMLYDEYLKPIGAGCVAAAGIISMFRTLPLIVRSFTSGVKTMRTADGQADVGEARKRRTEDDMPPSFVLGGNF